MQLTYMPDLFEEWNENDTLIAEVKNSIRYIYPRKSELDYQLAYTNTELAFARRKSLAKIRRARKKTARARMLMNPILELDEESWIGHVSEEKLLAPISEEDRNEDKRNSGRTDSLYSLRNFLSKSFCHGPMSKELDLEAFNVPNSSNTISQLTDLSMFSPTLTGFPPSSSTSLPTSLLPTFQRPVSIASSLESIESSESSSNSQTSFSQAQPLTIRRIATPPSSLKTNDKSWYKRWRWLFVFLGGCVIVILLILLLCKVFGPLDEKRVHSRAGM